MIGNPPTIDLPECKWCETPLLVDPPADAERGLTIEHICEYCSARHSLVFDPRDVDEDGTMALWECVRWRCRHGVVDYERCTACEVLEGRQTIRHKQHR